MTKKERIAALEKTVQEQAVAIVCLEKANANLDARVQELEILSVRYPEVYHRIAEALERAGVSGGAFDERGGVIMTNEEQKGGQSMRAAGMVLYQGVEPSARDESSAEALVIGDIWIDPSTYRVLRWSGYRWDLPFDHLLQG